MNKELNEALLFAFECKSVIGHNLDEHSAQNHFGELPEAYRSKAAQELRATHIRLQKYKDNLGHNSWRDMHKLQKFYLHYCLNLGLSKTQAAERYCDLKIKSIIKKYGKKTYFDNTKFKSEKEVILMESIPDNFKKYFEPMKKAHKDATDKQIYNVLSLIKVMSNYEVAHKDKFAYLGVQDIEQNFDRMVNEYLSNVKECSRNIKLYSEDRANINWYCF